MRAWLLDGVAGPRVRWRGGRPPKLTQAQRRRLAAIIEGGPAAAGCPTGCWHARLIQPRIEREFGVTYAELARQIATIIRERGLTQNSAARILGIDQPKVSALLTGRLFGFSLE